MKWMPTCRETTALASRALDEHLPLADRMALRLHLSICRNCARFARQLQDMRRLLRSEAATSETAPGLSDPARERIAAALQKKLGS